MNWTARSPRTTALTLVIVLTVAFGLTTATTAVADSSDHPDAAVLESSLIVLPEELRAYGVSEDEIAAQQDLIDSLTPQERAQQDELRAQQDAITAEVMAPWGYVKSDGTVVGPDGSAPTPKAEVTPFAYGDSCSINTAAKYQLRWLTSGLTYAYICVYGPAGTVTYYGGIDNVYAINSGTLTGRVNYHQDNNYYWSVWRNDGIWHEFYLIAGTVQVFKVQIA